MEEQGSQRAGTRSAGMRRSRGNGSSRGGGVISPPVLGDLARRILGSQLGSSGHCLFLATPTGGLVPLLDSHLYLDPRDPWTTELGSPRVWEEAAGVDALVSLARLPRRPGLPEPDSTLHLLPILESGSLRGGLAVRGSENRGSVSPTLKRRLGRPEFLDGISLLLTLGNTALEREELTIFRAAVGKALPYGILVIDGLGRVTYAGGRASAILGIQEEETVGSDCTRVFRPVGLERNPLLEGLRGHAEPVELYLAHPDGGETPVSLQMTLLPGRPGSPRLLAFFQDLSEERTLEEAARQRDRLAALGELSAGVAHEIRNPLTGIANCAQVLREGLDPDDDRQRFLKIILDETARLNRIVEGLLRYARPNRPELCESSLEDSVRRVLDLVRPGMEEKGIRVSLRLSGRVPRIYFDPGQIEQVLLNLLRNAEESMPSGGEIRCEVSVVRRRAHRRRGAGRRATDRIRLARDGPLLRYVQVLVADAGHGIAKEILHRIFNPFFTTRARGTGLGLALAQAIVRSHEGFLSVRSVEGKGTTVLLDLPVERRHGERRKEPR